MIERESHLAKLEAKSFEFPESYNTGVYNTLPAKTIIPALCNELQSYPIISCIFFSCHKNHLRKFYIAKAIKNKLPEVDHIGSTGCLEPLTLYA